MSTAESWDLVVPDDDAALVAELRRHGVRPGKHLFVLEAADDHSVDTEGLREAMALARAVADAIAATHGEAAASLRAAMEPALEALRNSVDAMPAIEVGLSETQQTALASLADALGSALRNVGTNNTAKAQADAKKPRRRLRFTGMIEAEPDLAENFDHYLAQSYGQD